MRRRVPTGFFTLSNVFFLYIYPLYITTHTVTLSQFSCCRIPDDPSLGKSIWVVPRSSLLGSKQGRDLKIVTINRNGLIAKISLTLLVICFSLIPFGFSYSYWSFYFPGAKPDDILTLRK